MKLFEAVGHKPKDIPDELWEHYTKKAEMFNLSLRARRNVKNPSISGPALKEMETSPWQLHAEYMTDPGEISARLTQFRLNPSKHTSYYDDLSRYLEKMQILKKLLINIGQQLQWA